MSGRRVLITGAAGSIGSELARQIAALGPEELVLVDVSETPLHSMRLSMAREFPSVRTVTVLASVASRSAMRRIFAAHRPHYVFHAAAYKHVPMMEDNPHEAVLNNVDGTRSVADLAVEFAADCFVMVSTDKAVNPTNVMGASKRIAEIYVQALGADPAHSTRFVTTRFGNVLGSNGSVIPLFMEQLAGGGPLTVTHPQVFRYFMLLPEACRLVLMAAVLGRSGRILVFDMGQPVTIAHLASRLIELYGTGREQIVYTGLRPGEKLTEELLTSDETTLPGPHPSLKVARVRPQALAQVAPQLQALVDLASQADSEAMDVVRAMKRIVKEFKSQNSPYEQLD